MKLSLTLALLLTAMPASAQHTINVSGDAEIKVAPDQVVLTLGVEVHAKLLADARRENDKRVQAVVTAAKRMGIQEKDVQTDFIQLGMAYENDGITPQYYYTRKSIVLVLHDATKMETVLAAAVDAGATHIHGVEFQTTRLREFRDQARALAVKAATQKARDMAGAAGLTVAGGPVSISSAQYGGGSWYGNGWGNSRGMMSQNVYQGGGSSEGGPQGTVALGQISVTAAVGMEFRLQ